jgi:hypothetical protein
MIQVEILIFGMPNKLGKSDEMHVLETFGGEHLSGHFQLTVICSKIMLSSLIFTCPEYILIKV